jgi:hypothetical protein
MSLEDSKFFQLIGILLSGFGIFVMIAYAILSWKIGGDWILTDSLWRILILGVIIFNSGLVSVGIGALLSKLKTLSS